MNTSHLKNQNTSSNLVHRRNPSGPAKKKKTVLFLTECEEAASWWRGKPKNEEMGTRCVLSLD